MTGDAQPLRALYAFVDAWNRGNVRAVMETFAETAVFIGGGDCKGCPCRGRAAIEAGLVADTLTPNDDGSTVTIAVSGVTTIGNRLDCWWVLENWPPEVGAAAARGWLTLTVELGLISYFRMKYDLTDPETVVVRRYHGETIFALPAPGQVSITTARVLLAETEEDPSTCRVIVYYGDPGSAQEPLFAHLYHDGDPGRRVAFSLDDVIDGQSETMVPAARETLSSGGYGIAVHRADGTLVADGKIPVVRPPSPHM